MRPALIVLDMISLFDFDGGDRLAAQALKVCKNIAALRASFAKQDWPVLYVNDNFMDWNREFSDLVAACRKIAGPTGAIATALGPGPRDYYVLKPRHSAFLCTTLPAILGDLRVAELVVTGIAADSCVLATAQDAHMRGYKVRVPTDAVAAQTAARSKRALALMSESMEIDIRPTATVARSLASQ